MKNKFSCTLFATVTSVTPLAKPMTIPYGNSFKKINSYPQETVVEIEFPQWPVPVSALDEALTAIRAEISKTILNHLDVARNKMAVNVLVEPVIWEKLEKYEKEVVTDENLGFAYNHIKERHEHTLDGYFINLAIPYIGNRLNTELTILKSFDLIKNNVKQVVLKAGVVA